MLEKVSTLPSSRYTFARSRLEATSNFCRGQPANHILVVTLYPPKCANTKLRSLHQHVQERLRESNNCQIRGEGTWSQMCIKWDTVSLRHLLSLESWWIMVNLYSCCPHAMVILCNLWHPETPRSRPFIMAWVSSVHAPHLPSSPTPSTQLTSAHVGRGSASAFDT